MNKPRAASPTTIVTQSSLDTATFCECELLSTDCLDAIACLPANPALGVAQGILLRRLLRQDTNRTRNDPPSAFAGAPIGKQTQFMTIQVWKQWRQQNTWPMTFDRGNKDSLFLNSTHYDACRQNEWKGKLCFFTLLTEGANETDWDELEHMAASLLQYDIHETIVRQDLQAYLRMAQSTAKQDKNNNDTYSFSLTVPAL